jgi:hypothetical protein
VAAAGQIAVVAGARNRLAHARRFSSCRFVRLEPWDRQEQVVNQADISKVQILSSGHQLPASARNVRLRHRHFQDSVLLIRFEAPLPDARIFAERLTGQKSHTGGGARAVKANTDDWWLDRYPVNGEGASSEGARMIASVIIEPRGDMGALWVFASGS